MFTWLLTLSKFFRKKFHGIKFIEKADDGATSDLLRVTLFQVIIFTYAILRTAKICTDYKYMAFGLVSSRKSTIIKRIYSVPLCSRFLIDGSCSLPFAMDGVSRFVWARSRPRRLQILNTTYVTVMTDKPGSHLRFKPIRGGDWSPPRITAELPPSRVRIASVWIGLMSIDTLFKYQYLGLSLE